MSKSYYDLIQPGMVQELGSYTFERDEVIEFAKEFDPQKFHLSEEAAAESVFGGLCASGWQTISVWMRLNVLNGRSEMLRLTKYDGPPPVLGPSPGVRNIKWLLPVYVGDTINFKSKITGKRSNPKRPGWGLLTSTSEGHNQDGARVISFDGAVTLRVD